MLTKLQAVVLLAGSTLTSASPLARRQTNETGVTPTVPEIPSTQFINYTQYALSLKRFYKAHCVIDTMEILAPSKCPSPSTRVEEMPQLPIYTDGRFPD